MANANFNTVVVLHNGASVTMPWIDGVEVSGDAAASLLYGESNPSGKLAETFPIRLEDTLGFLNFPDERGGVYREGDL